MSFRVQRVKLRRFILIKKGGIYLISAIFWEYLQYFLNIVNMSIFRYLQKLYRLADNFFNIVSLRCYRYIRYIAGYHNGTVCSVLILQSRTRVYFCTHKNSS